MGFGLSKEVIQLLFDHRVHPADVELLPVVCVDDDRESTGEEELTEVRAVESTDGTGLLQQDMTQRVDKLEHVLCDLFLDRIVEVRLELPVPFDWREVIEQECPLLFGGE